jgi:hypothetical protein
VSFARAPRREPLLSVAELAAKERMAGHAGPGTLVVIYLSMAGGHPRMLIRTTTGNDIHERAVTVPGFGAAKARFLASLDVLVAVLEAGTDSRLVVLRVPAAP